MTDWVLASNNQGKLAEFQRLFDEHNIGVTFIPQAALGIDDAVEDGLSFVENAIIKARHASAKSGLPALADDSGLCVPVLGGAPGVHSARFAGVHGDDAANNQKLLDQVAPYRQRGQINAYFVCVLVWVAHAHDPLPIIAEGRWWGHIGEQPKGEGGFGYDPIFRVDNDTSAAMLTPQQKNALSHRAIAIGQLLNQLKGGMGMI